ncbi:glycosyltransferase family 39 protein [Thermoflexus sp.]|uniref:glycosyltransferase family 39 protein n=1 Tax=Thermoflexus sp. TaxID=1969742 RepID=UPI00262823D7|nr:glycosyltransferase family 39 protein [Thermoflexus sp.]MCX7689501.1 glycosyltransferase family 39 protein [Thermoflexus sp.]
MRRSHWWVLSLAGLLLAFALRVYRLGDQNVWWDEGFTVWLARQPFLEMTLGTARDTHPPLYYWLLWPWIRLVGDGEFAARYLSAMLGVLTVAVIGAAGRRLDGIPTGLLALWLMGLSRFHIWWSQEIRMYALATLGVALALETALRAQRAPDGWRNWILWALAATAALFSVYLNLFALIPISLGFWLTIPRRLWPRWALAHGMVMIPFALWLAVALPRMATWSAAAQPPSFPQVLRLGLVLWTVGISTYPERWIGLALMLLAGMVVGLAFRFGGTWAELRHRLQHPAWLMLGGGLLFQLLMVWWITQPRSFLYTPRLEARYFIPSLPFFVLLLAWSVGGLFRKIHRRPLVIGLAVGFAFIAARTLPDYYMARHWEADPVLLPYLIHVYARPGDGVILVSGDRFPTFLYYYERGDPAGPRPPVYLVPRGASPVRADTVEAELRDIAARHPRLWLARVESHFQDPEGLVERWLEARFHRSLTFSFRHNALILFSVSPQTPAVPKENLSRLSWIHPLQDPQGILIGYDQIGRIFRPGESIRSGLYLRASPSISWTLRWVHESKEVIARQAISIPDGSGVFRYSAELPITPYTPSGSYTLEIERNGERVARIEGFQVEQTLSPPQPAEIPHRMSARLGDGIRFLGYRLRGTHEGNPPVAYPGSTILLDLYWEAEKPIERSYVVFTHLIGEAFNPATGNPVWAQDDQVPLEGAYPTTHWIPGRPLRDRYELSLPPSMPPGEYILEIGMYLLETGERLPVSGDGADPAARRILLSRIRVLPKR